MDAGRSGVHGAGAGAARAANEPVVAGPLFAARLREERVRRPRVRPRRPRAAPGVRDAARFAVHHTGTDAELDAFVKDVQKIIQQEGAIYGEYPEYEPGHYTFLAEYLPYSGGDGMEHRNSTVITSSGSIRERRIGLLGTVA